MRTISENEEENFDDLLYGFQADAESHDPVVHDNGVSYLFLQHNNVYLMAASRQNCNAGSILFFLHRIVDVSSSIVFPLQLFYCLFSVWISRFVIVDL